MSKLPKAKAAQVPEYETLNHAAKVLGKSRAFVKKAVDLGLLRSTDAPFKSNLNKGGSSHMVLVNLQDIRDALAGKIDLSSLDEVPAVTRKQLPEDMTEFAERFVNLEQTVEQMAVMLAKVYEFATTGAMGAKKKKEIPDA